MEQYEKLNFVNGSPPALNAATLNHMDDGIAAATEGVIAVEKTVQDNKTETDTALAKKSDKATTLAGYGITDGEKIANKITDKSKITDEDANYPSIGYLNNYYYDYSEVDDALFGKLDKVAGTVKSENIVNGAITNDKLADEVRTSINNKYDSSNVETGSGTLTPYTTSADIVKSADFTFQRIGRVATVNVNIVFTAGTKSQVMFTNLPYVCKNTVNPRELCVSNSKVSRIWAINKNNTTLSIFSDSSLSYAEDETLAFTLSYLVS